MTVSARWWFTFQGSAIGLADRGRNRLAQRLRPRDEVVTTPVRAPARLSMSRAAGDTHLPDPGRARPMGIQAHTGVLLSINSSAALTNLYCSVNDIVKNAPPRIGR
jgi:hypothetical protein